MIGNILGNRYRILREIGTGGMAKVYLAEDINEGQTVAVKVMHPHFSEDISYLQRFTREAKLAMILQNPHVVRMIDYGSTRDIHYLVMEYVEGQNLREYLNERGPLPWEEALSLTDQIAEALEVANEHNIVHRDIKPQNAMLTENGLLKVLDFGIARTRMLPSLTQSGFVGSPYYIAPEQAMGEAVDIRSDIYSSGIVLYELLSGRVPFDAKNAWSIISKHIANEPPQIEVTDQKVPQHVQNLLKRMVSKRPEDRFQNPTVLRQAIAAVLTGKSLPTDLGAPPPTDIDRTAMADTLYRRGEEAMIDEDWQKAVNLFNQALNLHPEHPQASQKLNQAGIQARLAALYAAATRAMEANRWGEAIDELTEIQEINADYKDSQKLMVQANDALNRQNEDLQLSDLYDTAMTAFEAGNYEKAEELFGKIKNTSPTYRRADALWAESRRRKTGGDGLSRLNKGLKAKKTGSGFPVKWIVGTIVIIIAITAVILLVSQNNAPPEDNGPSLETLYSQAESAAEANNLEDAERLLEQILAQDPQYSPALSLKERLSRTDNLNRQLAQAQAAIAEKDWTKAIEQLEPLQIQENFEPETVAQLLCDAYLNRGLERLERVSNPRDRATIQAALTDFSAGQQICPERNILAEQSAFAAAYLTALQNNANVNSVIDVLLPIVQANPAYAGGQAAENLYQAYIRRGDAYTEAKDINSALEDYNAALRLNVADLTIAQNKQAQALQALATAPTLTPTSDPNAETPTAEPTASATDTPPPTKIPATPSGFVYPAPTLSSPAPFADFAGEFAEITLAWEPVGPLASDEFYDVTIRYFVGAEPRYWGSGLIKETTWRVPKEAGYGLAGNDEFDWWVTVRQAGTAPQGQPDTPLSPPSEERRFLWRP